MILSSNGPETQVSEVMKTAEPSRVDRNYGSTQKPTTADVPEEVMDTHRVLASVVAKHLLRGGTTKQHSVELVVPLVQAEATF